MPDGIGKWFCRVHVQTMLVRTYNRRGNNFGKPDEQESVIFHKAYCPKCWRSQMRAILKDNMPCAKPVPI